MRNQGSSLLKRRLIVQQDMKSLPLQKIKSTFLRK
jgi:hypothetical protein